MGAFAEEGRFGSSLCTTHNTHKSEQPHVQCKREYSAKPMRLWSCCLSIRWKPPVSQQAQVSSVGQVQQNLAPQSLRGVPELRGPRTCVCVICTKPPAPQNAASSPQAPPTGTHWIHPWCSTPPHEHCGLQSTLLTALSTS